LHLVALPIVQAWYIPQQQAIVNSINNTKFKRLSMVLLVLRLMFCKKVSEFIGLIFKLFAQSSKLNSGSVLVRLLPALYSIYDPSFLVKIE